MEETEIEEKEEGIEIPNVRCDGFI